MKLVTPVLYLLVYLTALGLTILVVATVEDRWVLHAWYDKGTVDAALASLIIGAVTFPLATMLAVKLDGLRRPGLTDHIRQSACVYALMVAGAAYAIDTHAEQRYSLGFGVAAGACLLGLYAAVLNGVVLWLMNRLSGHRPAKVSRPGT